MNDNLKMADRSADGGTRHSAPHADSSRRSNANARRVCQPEGQAFSCRRLQPLRGASASHSGGGQAVERMRANQTRRYARGALRRTRPTDLRQIQPNRTKSRLIVLNPIACLALIGPSDARCSGQASWLRLFCLLAAIPAFSDSRPFIHSRLKSFSLKTPTNHINNGPAPQSLGRGRRFEPPPAVQCRGELTQNS